MPRLERLGLWVPALALMVGCGGGDHASSQGAARYRVRAEVVELAGNGADQRVTMAHEAIAGFKDRSGVAARMPPMKMAFGIGPNIDAKAFVPGSKWELDFEVVWDREPVLRIVSCKPLAADTQLSLSEAS